MKTRLVAALIGAVLGWNAPSAAASTLQEVKAKGFVQCGVHEGLQGFAAAADNGEWQGMDVDVCRALAAAIFGDPKKVQFTPLSAEERFTALLSGEIDVLARNTTWTMTRDTKYGLNFAGVTYYDGQGFMVRKKLGISSALELSGATVCIQKGTTTELNAADFFTTKKMPYKLVSFEKADETLQAYDAGRCDVFTSDASQLYAMRLKLTNPDEHMVLPEIISKEPLGPVVRQGDDQWFNLVRWTCFAILNGEELGVTSQNVDAKKSSSNPAIRRLLGVEGEFGKMLGIENDWAYRIIKMVGNYGEIFERNVGENSPLKIARGVNALWSKGGIQYAPPIR
ncbi:MAG: amino acid ABC transporter substrate-binding protein [Hyphomicrobiales bacterium]|nr:amino acid ABC transporter substrate-binding protein [Hyphomicrobiales bacterium]